MPSAGDQAPDFELLDQHQEAVSLRALRGRKVLVYFYPKADTPGCTKQACGLNEVLGDIGDAAVLGISPDKPAKQLKFAEKYSLGFPLLADTDHAVAEAFGVWKEKSMYGRTYMGIERSAFLVDEEGAVAEAWYKISRPTPPSACSPRSPRERTSENRVARLDGGAGRRRRRVTRWCSNEASSRCARESPWRSRACAAWPVAGAGGAGGA